MKFIVDANVGKLTKLLRLLGCDAVFFTGPNDGQMISRALAEQRIILTRDTHIPKWGVVRRGEVRALLIRSDDPGQQADQVVREFRLHRDEAFSLCLECNVPLTSVDREAARNRVPPYVFQTQQQFLECPGCHRLYWRGTHWADMVRRLERLSAELW